MGLILMMKPIMLLIKKKKKSRFGIAEKEAEGIRRHMVFTIESGICFLYHTQIRNSTHQGNLKNLHA